MEHLILDCAKKYLTYPDVSANSLVKKKISFSKLAQNVYIYTIDAFVTKKSHYKNWVEKHNYDNNYEYVLFVSAESQSKGPIELPTFDKCVSFFIILEDCAQITFYDFLSNKASVRSIKVFIGNSARMEYIYVHEEQHDSYCFSQIECYLQKDSILSFIPLIAQANFTQLVLNLFLQQPGAQATVAGYYWLKDAQQCALKVLQHHQAEQTKSSLTLNGVLFDAAQAVYDGTIVIDEDANQSNADQTNKNLLFGQKARAISVPNLEVKTNEVQCKHGSAIGKLDNEQLFYLQARGISLIRAKQLLLESFLLDSFKKMEPSVLEYIKKTIQKLADF